MHLLRARVHEKAFTEFSALLLLAIFVSGASAFPQARTVTASIDVSRTSAPISKNIYGQYLEHGGDIVNNGIWSEMLVDRKFFYPVAAGAPTPPLGTAYRKFPLRFTAAADTINATVQVDKKPEVQVEKQSLGALPDTITVRPFSVNIYSYPVQ